MASPVNASAAPLGLNGSATELASLLWYHPVVFGFRRMFVFVSSSETSFETVKDVPNYVEQAFPYFFAFILIELVILHLQGKHVRLNDSMSSFLAGIFSLLPNILVRPIELVTYMWVYENFRLIELPWDHPATWWLAFIGVDFGYYWVHRMGHEINFMWAAHQVHHSSEEYNLTTALRQSLLQKYNSWIFYLPVAFAVPPSAFLVHSYFNLLYQFWIHTEVVKTLGPLEYILNTPSHHRVHHGRNRYCIDKNYGGTLIIWDRLFNTFAAEDDEVIYGLVHPLASWDTMYIQFCHWQYMFKTAWGMQGLSNKLAVFWKGPGWEPGKPRMGLPEDIPVVPEIGDGKYDKNIPSWFHFYTYSHFIGTIVAFAFIQYLKVEQDLDFGIRALSVLYLIWTLTDIGFIYEHKWYVGYLELVRCLVYLGADFYLCSGHCSNLLYIPRALYMLSLSIWLVHFTKLPEDKEDATKKVS